MTAQQWTTFGPSGSTTARERAGLADLLDDLGPDAPTLCEGWDTRALAAHVVTRESDLLALAGVLVPPLHGQTARREDATRSRRSYEQLVQAIHSGPPLARTPVALPGLVGTANLHEFFVHHEDVRRAQPGWSARSLPQDTIEGLRRRLVVIAPLLFARLRGVKLTLATPDGVLRRVGRGDDEVTVTGPVPELFLYAFGRRSAAEVSISGSVAGQAKLAAANLSR
jgi:uncharacterized protein (TIGR03085 family)